MIKVDIEELVNLNKSGMTDERIAEYLTECGVKISKASVTLKLNEYYKSIGEKKPKWNEKISNAELAELKEKDMSDIEIVEHLKKQGIKISVSTVGNRLKKYYEAMVEKKPRASITRNNEQEAAKREEIIEKIVILREQGKSLREIEKYLQDIGKPKSRETIRKIISANCIIEEKPEVKDEELVELKDKRMSDKEIAQYFAEKGIVISTTSVGRRLREYYESIGQEKTRRVSDEELVELKEQGMSDRKIVQHLEQTGRKMSLNGVAKRLRKYYKAREQERLTVRNRTRKVAEQQEDSKSKREEFIGQIKVTTPIQPVSSQDKCSENVKNYSREDEER